jgi:hypothetical protein
MTSLTTENESGRVIVAIIIGAVLSCLFVWLPLILWIVKP